MSLHFCKHTMVVFPHNSQTFTMNKPCLLEFRSNNVVDWTIIHCDSRRSRSCVGWNVQVLLHNCSGIWPLHVFNKCVILLLDCDWKVVGSLFCIIYIMIFLLEHVMQNMIIHSFSLQTVELQPSTSNFVRPEFQFCCHVLDMVKKSRMKNTQTKGIKLGLCRVTKRVLHFP